VTQNSDQYWSTYWSQGKLNSFADNRGENYEGELLEYWRSLFQLYKHTNVTVVDIGCGNGALFEIALRDKMDEANFIGIDSATLNVPSQLRKANIFFKENTLAEKSGLKTKSVDLVISQFGIEYSPLEKAFEEVNRILKPGGSMCCIVHDSNSIIYKRNELLLNCLKILGSSSSPILTLKGMMEAITNFGKKSKQAEQFRILLNSQIHSVIERFGHQTFLETNFPALLRSVLAKGISEEKKSSQIQNFEFEFKAHQLRLRDLTDVAFTQIRKAEVEKLLRNLGFLDIYMAPLTIDKQIIGTVLRARKAV